MSIATALNKVKTKAEVSQPLHTTTQTGDLISGQISERDRAEIEKQKKIAAMKVELATLEGASNAVVETVSASDPNVFIYSCPTAHAPKLQLSSGEVQAKNGTLKVDKEQHEEIQKLIKSGRNDISQMFILLDPDAAAAVAKRHMEEHKTRQQAARGMTSTSHSAAKMQTLEGHEIPDRLSDLHVIETEIKHAEDNNLNPETGVNADNIPRT